jgi:argonaute-like protein implicated in RNA metabolism and viral defense
MLGKSGGVPWVLTNMDSDVDCFIGLDVGNPDRKNIRYPSCSIVFDKFGTLIGYFRPKLPQTGEKIVDEILQDIFDRVLLSYSEKYGAYPKHIVVHRDGFARENIEWFKTYFGNKDIIFDIVEVKKDGAVKFGEIHQNFIFNPLPGVYLTDGEVAYLITTDIPPNKKKNKKGYLGSPNPLKIQKLYGDSSLDDLVKQIYYLSEIHIGSIKSTRLPVTTGYADRISKSVRFIPEGKLDNRLFFL